MLVDAVTAHARLCRKPAFSNEPSVIASGLVHTPCFRVRDFNEKPWVVPLSMRHEVSDLRGCADLADCHVVCCCAAGMYQADTLEGLSKTHQPSSWVPTPISPCYAAVICAPCGALSLRR